MFTRKKKSSQKLLEHLMGRLGDKGARLILPEVIQLELEKVLRGTRFGCSPRHRTAGLPRRPSRRSRLLGDSAKQLLHDYVAVVETGHGVHVRRRV